MLISMMYHYVHAENDSSIFAGLHGLNISDFKKQLDFLCEYFTPVSHMDLFNHFNFGKILPKQAFILTFDDGFKQHYTNVYPILKAYGLSASFFIPTMPLFDKKIHLLEKQRLCQYSIYNDYHEFLNEIYMGATDLLPTSKHQKLEPTLSNLNKTKNYLPHCNFYSKEERFFRFLRDKTLTLEEFTSLIDHLFQKHFDEDKLIQEYYLNSEEILELSLNGMCIGGHSYSHPHLEQLSENESLVEIQTGLTHLKSITGEEIKTFSYPFGTYNENTIQQLKDLNIPYAFTTQNSTNDNLDKRFELARIDSANFNLVKNQVNTTTSKGRSNKILQSVVNTKYIRSIKKEGLC